MMTSPTNAAEDAVAGIADDLPDLQQKQNRVRHSVS